MSTSDSTRTAAELPFAVEAVILAGGFGTRLLPLTARRPKHLLEVGGVPFLEHQISRLAAAGVEHIVLATSYRADLFEPVLGDGSRWGVRLSFVQEQEPLGTAGAIRNVSPALDDDPESALVVLNGDVLSGHDLTAQLDDFATSRDGRPVDVSLHLVDVADARAFGCVPTDDDGRVTGFIEKSDHPVTNRVNAGCYVFRRRIVDLIPVGQVVSVERDTFPALVASGALVVGYVESAYWRDVGTPLALVQASQDLVLGAASSPASRPGNTGAVVDRAAQVHPSARVDGGSVVLDRAVIGPGATIAGSVVMAAAVVEAGARVVDTVLGPGASVGARVRLERVTLGDDARVESGVEVEPGSRIDCGAVVAPLTSADR